MLHREKSESEKLTSELSNGRVVDLSFVSRRIRSSEVKFTFIRIAKFERVEVPVDELLSLKRLEQGIFSRVADRRESETDNSVDISVVELRRDGRGSGDVCKGSVCRRIVRLRKGGARELTSILDFESSDIDRILE